MRESGGLNVRHRYETAITQFNSQQEITNQKDGILAKTSMKKEMDYLFQAYGYRLGGFLNDDPGHKTISAVIESLKEHLGLVIARYLNVFPDKVMPLLLMLEKEISLNCFELTRDDLLAYCTDQLKADSTLGGKKRKEQPGRSQRFDSPDPSFRNGLWDGKTKRRVVPLSQPDPDLDHDSDEELTF